MTNEIMRARVLAASAAAAALLASCSSPPPTTKNEAVPGLENVAQANSAAARAAAAEGEPFGPPLARERLAARLPRLFARLDRNSDGAITADEVLPRDRAEWRSFDADGDGRVTPEEFAKGLTALFERHDRNGDGVLEDNERGATANGG